MVDHEDLFNHGGTYRGRRHVHHSRRHAHRRECGGSVRPVSRIARLTFGLAWAWAVTLIEIIGGTLLLLGRYTAPLAAYFIIQTALGIWWVHWHAGWFVVGLGRNGMEYSVLLIACLIAVLLGKK